MNINLIDEILHTVEQHGLSLVLLCIVLFWLVPKLNQMWKVVMDQKKPPEVGVEKMLKFDMAIKGILRESLVLFKADWAHLWQFHNGTYGVGKTHIPFLYISLTHEAHVAAVQPLQPHFRELPTAMIDRFGEALMQRDLIFHCPEMTQTGGIGMSKLGANEGFILPIRDEDGEIIALFAVGYAHKYELPEEKQKLLRQTAQRLGITLATLGEENTNG